MIVAVFTLLLCFNVWFLCKIIFFNIASFTTNSCVSGKSVSFDTNKNKKNEENEGKTTVPTTDKSSISY